MVQEAATTAIRHLAEIRHLGGRDHELQVLGAAVEAARRGTPRVVVLEGPAGIGKTALLRLVEDAGPGLGLTIRSARADLMDRPPFGLLRDALGADVARVPSGGRAPHDVRYDVIEDIVEEVGRLSRHSCGVLLDDLHWADHSSLLAVRALARRLTDVGMLLLLATRPVIGGGVVERLLSILEGDEVQLLRLEPLSPEAVQVLAHDLVGRHTDPPPADHLARAGGNPLFIRALVGRDLAGEAPLELSDAVARSLRALSPGERYLLEHAAVLGVRFRAHELSVVADRDPVDVVVATRALLRSGVLVEASEELEFSHDVVRQVLLDAMPRSTRSVMHERAAWQLAAGGCPPERVAEQLLLAGSIVDTPRAAKWLRSAAADVLHTDPAAAARLLRHAETLLDLEDEERAWLVMDLLEALLRAGEVGDAVRRARAAARDQLTPAAAERLKVLTAEALTASGELHDVLEVTDLTCPVSPAAAAHLLALAANAHDLLGDLATADQIAIRALVTTGEGVQQGHAMARLIRSDVARVQGLTDQALDHARVVRDLEDQHGPRSAWPPEIFIGLALNVAEQPDEAVAVAKDGMARCTRWGRVAYLPALHTVAAEAHAAAGRWDDALAEARTALAVAADVELGLLDDWPRGVAAELLVRRGDLKGAQEILAPVVTSEGRPRGPAPRAKVVLAAALLLEASGDAASALEMLSRAWATSDGPAPAELAPDIVRLAREVHDHVTAGEVVAGLSDEVGDGASAGRRALLLRCQGLARDDTEAAMSAVDLLGTTHLVPAALGARSDAGVVLARQGDARAPEVLQSAVSGLERLGAVRDARRVTSAAREHGIQLRRSTRRGPSTGPAALTPAEHEVAALAAAGLTNPEIGARLFISPRTVQSHLAATYRKLGISSRVLLATTLSRPPEE